MRKFTFALPLILILGLISGCSLNHRYNALEEASYRAAGIETHQNTAPAQDPAEHLENRVKAIPGIANAHVLFYGVDNLIVGIDLAQGAHNNAYRISEDRVRQELQGESKDFLVYIVTEKDTDVLTRVRNLRNDIRRGQSITEGQLLSVVNGVWKSIVPLNLLSKS